MTATNLQFYERLWSGTHLEEPHRFNTWPLIRELANARPEALEVGPGLRPRLPLEGTCFVDVSREAAERLRRRGSPAVAGDVTALPFPDRRFDLVGAFDIVEHVADDAVVFRELSRVLRDGGIFVFSVPLYARFWTEFDVVVGHVRRYEPEGLERSIAEHGFLLERSAAYGMQAKNPWLLRIASYWLRRYPESAIRWYNRVFLPLGMLRQKPLRFEPGLVRDGGVDEVIVVCRRAPRSGADVRG
jgi:SAM-dependent methyltransferase